MLLVQYGYIFLVLIFLLLFSSPEGSENKETKISELGKYISYCTLSRAITITYTNTFLSVLKKRIWFFTVVTKIKKISIYIQSEKLGEKYVLTLFLEIHNNNGV